MGKRGRPKGSTKPAFELEAVYRERQLLQPLQRFMTQWVIQCQLIAIDRLYRDDDYEWPLLPFNQELQYVD